MAACIDNANYAVMLIRPIINKDLSVCYENDIKCVLLIHYSTHIMFCVRI